MNCWMVIESTQFNWEDDDDDDSNPQYVSYLFIMFSNALK